MTHTTIHACLYRTAVLVAVAGTALIAPARQPTGHERPAENYQPARDARPVILVPAGSVANFAVWGAGDQSLGEVNDLVISRLSGRVAFVLVGHGGVVGIGEKVTAVPYGAFDWDQSRNALKIPLTPERLKAAPTIDPREWKTLADPSLTEGMYSYFNVVRDRPAEIDPPDARPGNSPRLTPQEHPLLRLADVRDNPLFSNDGREVGKVNDLVMDARSGRIALVVVTFGGVMGVGGERVPMPWPVFDVNKDGHLYAVNIDREQLKAAPRLSEKGWAELREPGYATRVYQYFGRSASWLDAEPSGSAEDARGRSHAAAEYDRLCARGTARTLEGTISSVEEAPPMAGLPEIVKVTLRADKGDPTVVHTAPRAFLEQHGVRFESGDKVSIKGREAEVDGKRCVIATELTPADGKPVALREPDGTCAWRSH